MKGLIVNTKATVGLGTFPFANPFTPIDEQEVKKVILAFLEMGARYIETVPVYASGETESMIGRILKNLKRERYFLSDMCGLALDESGQFKRSGKYNDVIASCNASLSRLGIDYFDLYISHSPDVNTPFQETIGAMVELKRQGKTRELGVSNVSLEQLKDYNATGHVKWVENRFSLLNRSLSPEFIGYCQEHGIGIIAFQVIERGLLTEKSVQGITLREGDLRAKKSEFAAGTRDVIEAWVRTSLKPISDDLGVSLPALAIWWAMQQPSIAVCLTGATKEEQIRKSLEALKFVPPAGTINRVEESYAALANQIEQAHSTSVRSFMGLD